MNKNTHRHQCEITFRWDEGDETCVIDIYTPEDVTDKKVNEVLVNTHEKLCEEEDIYGTMGRCPETLATEVCGNNGWAWRVHEDSANDIELTLD